MDLARHQRDLYALIKRGTAGEAADAYVQAVSGSAPLAILRDIVLSWRRFDVERACGLTSRLLKQKDWFETTVQAFAEDADISPFVEQLRESFLERMARHEDPLVAAVASFEWYVGKVKSGDPADYTIDWPSNPEAVLSKLIEDRTVDPPAPGPRWRMLISHRNPGLISVSPLE